MRPGDGRHGRGRAGLSGPVSVGLAPGTAAAALSLPLLRTVRARHPGILLYLNENYGTTLCELIMNGRMDLAVLYGGQGHPRPDLPAAAQGAPVPGRAGVAAGAGEPVRLADRTRSNCSCRDPTTWCASWSMPPARLGIAPRIVAEIESAFTLTAAIADGLGATILPASMAREVVAACGAWQFQIVDPVIEAPLALCQSDHLPLSEPAQAVKDILLELVTDLDGGVAIR